MSSDSEGIEIEFLPGFSIIEDSFNGFNFNGIYIPAEIIGNIFTNLSPKDVLRCSLVCKNWFNIARSTALWQSIYNEKERPKKAKALPWYVFYCYFTTDYFKNLIRNGNGEEGFKYWEIMSNGGDRFVVEKEPGGSDTLPEGISEFHGHTSCFATSYGECLKYQKIDITSNKLLGHILRKYKPVLYGSEWYAGRFDCACYYRLSLICDKSLGSLKLNPLKSRIERFRDSSRSHLRCMPSSYLSKDIEKKIEQWSGKAWEKVELKFEDYPPNVKTIYFLHGGKDLQFWAGHYGSKMAGGVLKFLFDTMEPTSEDICESEDALFE